MPRPFLLACLTAVVLVFVGCGSLRPSEEMAESVGLKGDLSKLNGRYASPAAPWGAESEFLLGCAVGRPDPVQTRVHLRAEPDDETLTFTFYEFEDGVTADEPFETRRLRGRISEEGVFVSSTRWDACSNPYAIIILGWGMR